MRACAHVIHHQGLLFQVSHASLVCRSFPLPHSCLPLLPSLSLPSCSLDCLPFPLDCSSSSQAAKERERERKGIGAATRSPRLIRSRGSVAAERKSSGIRKRIDLTRERERERETAKPKTHHPLDLAMYCRSRCGCRCCNSSDRHSILVFLDFTSTSITWF